MNRMELHHHEFFKCSKCNKTRFNMTIHPSKFVCKNCRFILHLNFYFKEDEEDEKIVLGKDEKGVYIKKNAHFKTVVEMERDARKIKQKMTFISYWLFFFWLIEAIKIWKKKPERIYLKKYESYRWFLERKE